MNLTPETTKGTTARPTRRSDTQCQRTSSQQSSKRRNLMIFYNEKPKRSYLNLATHSNVRAIPCSSVHRTRRRKPITVSRPWGKEMIHNYERKTSSATYSDPRTNVFVGLTSSSDGIESGTLASASHQLDENLSLGIPNRDAKGISSESSATSSRASSISVRESGDIAREETRLLMHTSSIERSRALNNYEIRTTGCLMEVDTRYTPSSISEIEVTQKDVRCTASTDDKHGREDDGSGSDDSSSDRIGTLLRNAQEPCTDYATNPVESASRSSVRVDGASSDESSLDRASALLSNTLTNQNIHANNSAGCDASMTFFSMDVRDSLHTTLNGGGKSMQSLRLSHRDSHRRTCDSGTNYSEYPNTEGHDGDDEHEKSVFAHLPTCIGRRRCNSYGCHRVTIPPIEPRLCKSENSKLPYFGWDIEQPGHTLSANHEHSEYVDHLPGDIITNLLRSATPNAMFGGTVWEEKPHRQSSEDFGRRERFSADNVIFSANKGSDASENATFSISRAKCDFNIQRSSVSRANNCCRSSTNDDIYELLTPSCSKKFYKPHMIGKATTIQNDGQRFLSDFRPKLRVIDSHRPVMILSSSSSPSQRSKNKHAQFHSLRSTGNSFRYFEPCYHDSEGSSSSSSECERDGNVTNTDFLAGFSRKRQQSDLDRSVE